MAMEPTPFHGELRQAAGIPLLLWHAAGGRRIRQPMLCESETPEIVSEGCLYHLDDMDACEPQDMPGHHDLRE